MKKLKNEVVAWLWGSILGTNCGYLPIGAYIDNTCGDRFCQNPDHEILMILESCVDCLNEHNGCFAECPEYKEYLNTPPHYIEYEGKLDGRDGHSTEKDYLGVK